MRGFKTLLKIMAFAAVLASLPVHAALPRYKVERIADPAGGGGDIFAGALNNLGQVAGVRFLGNGGRESFIYQNGHMTRPAGLAGVDVFYLQALNDAGDVGGSLARNGGGLSPFVTRGGQVVDLGAPLDATFGQVAAINQSSHAVGYVYSPQMYYRAFIHDGRQTETFENIDTRFQDINNHDVVIHPEGYVLEHGNRFFLPGLDENHYGNRLLGLNDAGQIVGQSVPTDGSGADPRPFLYSNGAMTDLGSLGGHYGEAQDVNEAGWVVGASQTQQGDLDAFLYRDGSLRNLEDLLVPQEQGRWDFWGAGQISERGQILAALTGRGALDFYDVLLTPVPEPGHATLMLAGLGVLGALARRRREVAPWAS